MSKIEEIEAFFQKLKKKGYNFRLGSIKDILKKLNNPEKELKAIHIGGTNGKGSVCAILSSILKEVGFKVGMYTSPHLKVINERIQINNRMITNNEFIKYFYKIRLYYSDQTYFEFLTALALLYFKEKKVDFVVVEVGLGGRLDATNVIKPLVTVITNVDIEHTEYLGDTIEDIAKEKAGIIKYKIPVVTGAKGKALEIIKEVCKKKKSPLYLPKPCEKINWPLNLKGDYQLENCAVALKVIDVLREVYNIRITNGVVRKALKKVKWPGRLEFIDKNVLVDCAHNPAGALALKKEIIKIRKSYKKIILIIGILKDKDKKSIVKILTPLADKVIVVRPKSERAASPKELVRFIDVPYKIIYDVKKALSYAKTISTNKDLIIVTGSIYVVGEII